jgi:hypothetical protein
MPEEQDNYREPYGDPDDEDEGGYPDWYDHPSLSAEERNPSLR